MAKNQTIIRDSREKIDQGWVWSVEGNTKSIFTDTKIEKLDAGDYCLEGHYELCVIERKQSIAELYTNLFVKENRIRFENELERLKDIKHKYILVESNIGQDILGMSLPQYKGYGPPASKIIEMLIEYQLNFDIIPLFVGDAGKKIASKIFGNIVKKYKL